MKNDSPCRNCTAETGRSATCHGDGTCYKYAKWKAEQIEEQRRIRTMQEELNTMRNYKVETALRNRKRRAHGDTRR